MDMLEVLLPTIYSTFLVIVGQQLYLIPPNVSSFKWRIKIIITVHVVPRLIVNQPEVTVTSSSIILNVDVNEDTNCEGVDVLSITVIVTGDATDLSQSVDFQDISVMLEPLSPGDYTCSVIINDGTGPIDSMEFPCIIDSEPSSELFIPVFKYIIPLKLASLP